MDLGISFRLTFSRSTEVATFFVLFIHRAKYKTLSKSSDKWKFFPTRVVYIIARFCHSFSEAKHSQISAR